MSSLKNILERIAISLEDMTTKKYDKRYLDNVICFDDNVAAYQWFADDNILHPIQKMNVMPLELLHNIDYQRDILMDNSQRFACGFSANNALLWGARGAGKSALVKAVVHAIRQQNENKNKQLILIEIAREDITHLQKLLHILTQYQHRFILFCDDLSFEEHDQSYKFLKIILEGSVQAKPDNVILYATSNRRHLMPRQIIENEKNIAIHANEVIDEKMSLSDRFGLWLGFHHHDQDAYIAMIAKYINHFDIPIKNDDWRAQALEWATTRGNRSGRTAWQFILDYAGRKNINIDVMI